MYPRDQLQYQTLLRMYNKNRQTRLCLDSHLTLYILSSLCVVLLSVEFSSGHNGWRPYLRLNFSSRNCANYAVVTR